MPSKIPAFINRFRRVFARRKPILFPPKTILFPILLHLFLIPALSQILTGQLTLRASKSWVDAHSILNQTGNDQTYLDGAASLRLMAQSSQGSHEWNIHYQLSAVGGETYQATSILLPTQSSDLKAPTTASTNIMDLSHPLTESNQMQANHLIDRLSYQYFADWGTLTIGRDVVTWGNGLVFNPLDLLNPFSPNDIERDYKNGQDLFLIDLYPAQWNHDLAWQLLLVPRRNPASGSIDSKFSSVAAKTHFFLSESEWDAMVAMHYNELHLGLGSAHTVGGAVVRADLLVGFADTANTRYSAIINIDYSWTLAGMNAYGLLEYSYQSVGESEIHRALSNHELLKRIARGEMFTYGEHYLAGALQLEVHPLLHAHISTILNLEDHSFLTQPYLTWDPLQNLQLSAGLQLSVGPENSEFGKITIPHSSQHQQLPHSAFIWMKWYF